MTIADIAAPAAATSFNVKLTKSQEDQQAAVVDKLIDSTAASAPSGRPAGVGNNLNVVA